MKNFKNHASFQILERHYISKIRPYLSGAGAVHLFENSGDFFKGFINPHRITYADCFYFVLVTMSTVGKIIRMETFFNSFTDIRLRRYLLHDDVWSNIHDLLHSGILGYVRQLCARNC